jgi:hypothetical protein
MVGEHGRGPKLSSRFLTSYMPMLGRARRALSCDEPIYTQLPRSFRVNAFVARDCGGLRHSTLRGTKLV